MRVKTLIRRKQKGAAAVEFAIVAPLMLAMMFTLFEIGWFYFTNSVLDAAATNAARLVRTGQVQGWAGTEEEVQTELFNRVCGITQIWGSCDNTLTVEVQTFASFAAMDDGTAATCADAQPDALDAIAFQPGGDQEIVRMRICILYDTINPLLGFRALNGSKGVDVSDGGSGRRRLVSTAIFRNEPYERNVLNGSGS